MILPIYKYPAQGSWPQILARPVFEAQSLTEKVSAILQAVGSNGDAAIAKYTADFDGVELASNLVSAAEKTAALKLVPVELQKAIKQAAANIEKFHRAQMPQDVEVETMPGVRCWQKAVPIEKVGLYIPGGTAPLFSTILMLGIPARIAGCSEIVLCTPPLKDGSLHPAMIYAAELIGINKVYKIGGAQAIAGMAFGTASIPRVDKIFGPGNQYVTCAKQLVSQLGTAIDMPAGPSEVLVYADEGANPEFVAADLLSQAEHGKDSHLVLIVEEEKILEKINEALQRQIEELPKKEFALAVIKNSAALLVKNEKEALEIINQYAPEHLILCCARAEEMAQQVRNAGSVFLGYYTPESAGDYASGTNHTLPTNGFAKAYSGVNLDAFFKKITYQQITQAGLEKLGPIVEIMAAAEDLQGHKNAISVRLEALDLGVPVRGQKPFTSNSQALSDEAGLGVPVRGQEPFTSNSRALSERAPALFTKSLARPNILALKPYSSARSEFQGEAKIWLDANECPESTAYNRYPDPDQKELKTAINKIYPSRMEQLFLGNGSDEAIDLLLRIFCEPEKDKIITLPPTYGMYRVAAAIQNVAVQEIPLTDNFQLDVEEILKYNSPDYKLLFICSPNNPTGNLMEAVAIEKILNNFPGIVVIDQAYIDFCPEASWLTRLDEFPNLVILQTFSKAWGAAACRLGMAFAHSSIIDLFNKVKAPYNVSTTVQQAVLENIIAQKEVAEKRNLILSEKEKLRAALLQISGVAKVFPSDANFLLCQVEQAKELYKDLLRQGIVVRDRSDQPGCKGCLRFTIGLPKENELLIAALNHFYKTKSISI